MMNILKRGLSLVLVLVMMVGLMPVTAFATVDNRTGRPKDTDDALVLSIYTGKGFPGEPAVYGTSSYKSFNSSFAIKSGQFSSSAADQLNWSAIDKDLVQGTSSGNTSVWGVYDITGTDKYFLEDASIIQPENEAKIIRAIKTELKGQSDEQVLSQYEIIWYVIKLQHSSGWRGTTEWHIDGVIKEKEKVSINYYGNGNTSGAAPLGTTTHTSGDPYTVLSQNTLAKKVDGVNLAFLGWSARADGTGNEIAFYQPGDVINPTESISLYAMWDTTSVYTATVNTYLDGVLTSDDVIHGTDRDLYMSPDNAHFYALTESSTGVYTTTIKGNGKLHLFQKNDDDSLTQIGNYQLTIYNKDASLDVHHYSVTYDANGGVFDSDPGKTNYLQGETVTAVAGIPTRDGYTFTGWKKGDGSLIQPGATVTDAIDQTITLTAQWERKVNVTINVTIDHESSVDNGHDKVDTRDDVSLALVSRANDSSAYLETGKTLSLSNEFGHYEGFDLVDNDTLTSYTATVPTFTDLPGGEVDYTVVTSKSGYDTTVEAKQDANGDWIIDVKMKYNPSNFDLRFTVELDESVSEQDVPEAVIVKVTFWAEDRGEWEIITQQAGNEPGVRVDIDTNTRQGTGEYPVWKFESNGSMPYGYRIVVTSFVYPDGTIVPVSEIPVVQDEKWSDGVYIATVNKEVPGGQEFGKGLDGAYVDKNTGNQIGTLKAVISMDLHDVTFDAQGGKVKGQDSYTVENQIKIPGFDAYMPVRDGGYLFAGWYTDQACTKPAIEGEDLKEDITLYAKWIEPLTISGKVTISGTYPLGGTPVYINKADQVKDAVVYLYEISNSKAVVLDSQTISFGDYSDLSSVEYTFSGIPNDGKNYEVLVTVPNYGTGYDNEGDPDHEYSADEYVAMFAGDNVANVDVYLEFAPPSYDQVLRVNAEQIGEGYRPTVVLAPVLYQTRGDSNPFAVISQHSVAPFGAVVYMTDEGTGSATQSVWKWHPNGPLYDYQMKVSLLYGDVEGAFAPDGAEFDAETAPYSITYSEPTFWDESAGAASGELLATLVPKTYTVTFDLAANDASMDKYWNDAAQKYQLTHTWSFDTPIDATPVREGYTFAGWKVSVDGAYADGIISADVHQDVVLTALWSRDCYTVTTVSTTGGNTAGDGTYDDGETATVSATANEDYIFKGWYENGELVSTEASYSFTVTSNRTLTAKFAIYYTITTIAQNGGSVSGGGQYEPNATATITAEADATHYFVGWYDEADNLVTADATYSLTVRENRTFTAKFEEKKTYTCDYVYIFGYTDSKIGATGPLLRGELAQMIYRLVKQQDPNTQNGGNSFSDTAGEWFESGMSYMAEMGAIKRDQQRAHPYAQVTRGETYKMICLGLGFTTDTGLSFSEYATILRNSGYLEDDGRVTAMIQRWEFCKLFNAILGRSDYCTGNDGYIAVKGELVTAETYGYTDLKPSDEYYRIMMIATSTFTDGKIDLDKRMERNTHDYNN